MAIQLPNPGLGDGQTGDNEYVMWTKVKDNFSNTTHAASKLVGTANGQIPLAENIRGVAFSAPALSAGTLNLESDSLGFSILVDGTTRAELRPQLPIYDTINHRIWYVTQYHSSEAYKYQTAFNSRAGGLWSRYYYSNIGEWSNWAKHYTSANTTKEEGTGYLVASSPVLKMQHDSFEKVHEANQLDIDIKHIKTGVYEITGTTGLREDDGWNLKPPKDVNGNVLCICEATESNGVITLKTYKKKFDFETVSIVADYEQPTDIPEGATVMLRFDDLPQEQLDEPIE